MNKRADDLRQQCLTPVENAAIIAALYATREKRRAHQVVWIQVAIVLLSAGIFYKLISQPQFAMALLSGGLVATVNGALLAWRMSRVDRLPVEGAHCYDNAHHQLRLMYFYAAERFLVVVLLLALCLVGLKLMPLAVLSGFVMGQVVLMAAQIFLNRFKFEY